MLLIKQSNGDLRVIREDTDPKFYGHSFFRADHRLMYHIKKQLNKENHVQYVKKEMAKDGHLTADDRPYIRAWDWSHCYAFDDYQLRDAAQDFNNGEVVLTYHDLKDKEVTV